MKTYSRKIVRYSDGESKNYTETYQQPVINRAVFLVFHYLWLASWKVKPLSWAVGQVDRIDRWSHRRHCNDDCGTWTRPNGEENPGCVHMPFDVRLDIKHYDLDMRNNANTEANW